MSMDGKIVEAIKKHSEDIKNNNFVSVISEVYLQRGAKGLGGTEKAFCRCADRHEAVQQRDRKNYQRPPEKQRLAGCLTNDLDK